MQLTLKVQQGVPILFREDGTAVGNVQNIVWSFTPNGLTVNVTFTKVPKADWTNNWVEVVPHSYSFDVFNFDGVVLDLPLDDAFFPPLADVYKKHAVMLGGKILDKEHS